MTEVRTRISGDYLKPNFDQAPGTTTTRRVSDGYFGRTVYTTPSYGYSSYRPFFSSPAPVYSTPVIAPARVASVGEAIASGILITALFIGAIAIMAAAPICHTEEVCTAGSLLKNCHLERVCHY